MKQSRKTISVLKTVGFWMLFLGIPIVGTAPLWIWGVFYIEALWSPRSLTPSAMDTIIETRPKNLRELKIEMGKKHSRYKDDWPASNKGESLYDYLERKTAIFQSMSIDLHKATWYNGYDQTRQVKYIQNVKTASIADQAMGMGAGETYYFLMDKDLNILGWLLGPIGGEEKIPEKAKALTGDDEPKEKIQVP